MSQPWPRLAIASLFEWMPKGFEPVFYQRRPLDHVLVCLNRKTTNAGIFTAAAQKQDALLLAEAFLQPNATPQCSRPGRHVSNPQFRGVEADKTFIFVRMSADVRVACSAKVSLSPAVHPDTDLVRARHGGPIGDLAMKKQTMVAGRYLSA